MPLSISNRHYSIRVEETVQLVTVAGKSAPSAILNVKREAMSDAKALEHLRTLVDASAMKENIPPGMWGVVDEELARRGSSLLKGARHKIAKRQARLERLSQDINRLPKSSGHRRSLRSRVAKMMKQTEATAARMDGVGVAKAGVYTSWSFSHWEEAQMAWYLACDNGEHPHPPRQRSPPVSRTPTRSSSSSPVHSSTVTPLLAASPLASEMAPDLSFNASDRRRQPASSPSSSATPQASASPALDHASTSSDGRSESTSCHSSPRLSLADNCSSTFDASLVSGKCSSVSPAEPLATAEDFHPDLDVEVSDHVAYAVRAREFAAGSMLDVSFGVVAGSWERARAHYLRLESLGRFPEIVSTPSLTEAVCFVEGFVCAGSSREARRRRELIREETSARERWLQSRFFSRTRRL
ncbi:hypothetical protein R3P38DRAFT_2775420 [Favolaschia claudopus]|uniref:Uncharacterized protein n=1 Tax=Favolaschia claudopus TaxID=2862362 RepID=A0AAW0BS88_9AGAR